jgi:hypothetical protein
VEGLANILGCRASSLPMKYLGLSLGASIKVKSIWDEIIEKIEHLLEGSKMIYLSKGNPKGLAHVVEALVLGFASFKVQGSTPHGCKQFLGATPLDENASDLISSVYGNF